MINIIYEGHLSFDDNYVVHYFDDDYDIIFYKDTGFSYVNTKINFRYVSYDLFLLRIDIERLI